MIFNKISDKAKKILGPILGIGIFGFAFLYFIWDSIEYSVFMSSYLIRLLVYGTLTVGFIFGTLKSKKILKATCLLGIALIAGSVVFGINFKSVTVGSFFYGAKESLLLLAHIGIVGFLVLCILRETFNIKVLDSIWDIVILGILGCYSLAYIFGIAELIRSLVEGHGIAYGWASAFVGILPVFCFFGVLALIFGDCFSLEVRAAKNKEKKFEEKKENEKPKNDKEETAKVEEVEQENDSQDIKVTEVEKPTELNVEER